MIEKDDGGLQAPNSLPLWHQAPKRKLLVVPTISIRLGLFIITASFFIIATWNLLTAVVKLNIIITLRWHKVIPCIVDSRWSGVIPRLTNWGVRKIYFGHNLLLPPLQLEKFFIHIPSMFMHLLRILITHVEASKKILEQ